MQQTQKLASKQRGHRGEARWFLCIDLHIQSRELETLTLSKVMPIRLQIWVSAYAFFNVQDEESTKKTMYVHVCYKTAAEGPRFTRAIPMSMLCGRLVRGQKLWYGCTAAPLVKARLRRGSSDALLIRACKIDLKVPSLVRRTSICSFAPNRRLSTYIVYGVYPASPPRLPNNYIKRPSSARRCSRLWLDSLVSTNRLVECCSDCFFFYCALSPIRWPKSSVSFMYIQVFRRRNTGFSLLWLLPWAYFAPSDRYNQAGDGQSGMGCKLSVDITRRGNWVLR